MKDLIATLSVQLSSRQPITASVEPEFWAAVALILAPGPDGAEALFIRRADRDGDPWSGHVALPGGREESDDTSLRITAERETLEEVGLDLRLASYVGQLDDLAPRTDVAPRIRRLPLLAVRPFVYALREPQPLLTLSHEVASVFWTPLNRLRHREVYRPAEIEVDGQHRSVDAFVVDDHIIWGMTERILRGFLALTPRIG